LLKAEAFLNELALADQADIDAIFVMFIQKFLNQLIKVMFNPVKAMSYPDKRKIYDQFNSMLVDEICRAILRNGERITLDGGVLLFEEGQTANSIGSKSEVFIISEGSVISRIKALETSSQSTIYRPGHVLGMEKLIMTLNPEGKGKEALPAPEVVQKEPYRCTAMTASKVVIIGLGAIDCLHFMMYKPENLTRLLQECCRHSQELQDYLNEVINVAKGLEIDINSFAQKEEIIRQMIEQGNTSAILGAITGLARQIKEYENFFQSYEQEMREKDASIEDFKARMQTATGLITHLISLSPDKTNDHLKGGAVTEKDIDGVISGLGLGEKK
jgi:hypothetical protein